MNLASGALTTVNGTGDINGPISNIAFQNFGDPLIIGETIYALSSNNSTTELFDVSTTGGEFAEYDHVAMGADGFLWVAGVKDDIFDQLIGLYKYDLVEANFEFIENEAEVKDDQNSLYKPRNIFANQDGIWFSYIANDIFHWNGSKLIVFNAENSNLPALPAGQGDLFVGDIEGTADGSVWITYGTHILRYDGN